MSFFVYALYIIYMYLEYIISSQSEFRPVSRNVVIRRSQVQQVQPTLRMSVNYFNLYLFCIFEICIIFILICYQHELEQFESPFSYNMSGSVHLFFFVDLKKVRFIYLYISLKKTLNLPMKYPQSDWKVPEIIHNLNILNGRCLLSVLRQWVHHDQYLCTPEVTLLLLLDCKPASQYW